MGQKVHPHGFRLGYIYDWNSKWFADRNYTELLHEDLQIRRSIEKMLPDAGICRVEIERNANQITVSIFTARPGIVIGRGGQRVDELRGKLEKVSGRRIRVNINEVRLPEVEAPLVARAVAEQIERRVSHRRAIKQAAMRAMQRGAQGVRIRIAGRLGGSDMSRVDQERQGRPRPQTRAAMLQPKRTKFRKAHRGRRRGMASGGNSVTFGDFGLQALGPCWMTARQIEAGPRAIPPYLPKSR